MTDDPTPPPAEKPPTGARQINVVIESSGRMVGVASPIDLTDDELLEIIAWMASPGEGGFRHTLRPPSSLIVPPQFQRRPGRPS